MALLSEEKFRFVSQGLSADTFAVVSFKGVEGLSRCYEFEINLVSSNAGIDLSGVLHDPATFTIVRQEGDIPFHGILAEFEQRHAVGEFVFYRAVLVPKMWWLGLTHHNQIFLDKSVPEILEAVLKDGGLTSNDFELRLKGTYPQWEFVCQYRESHLSFVSRWMERGGLYYYFEQNEAREKVILTDSRLSHTEMPQGKTMHYSLPSGLDESQREEEIFEFVCRQKMLPKKVFLKDYNYRTPSLDITGKAEVSPNGRGEIYIYGEHFKTPEEGDALAKVRAEELLCGEKRFMGESSIPFLRPGYAFDLKGHYRADFNQRYLTIEAEHEGNQTGYLISGLRQTFSEAEEEPYYRNSFMAIPAAVQFRAERKTERARFYGTMNARIDASGSGKYAELDEHGRYKVILPFDLSGRKDGKGSAWLRMAQPYGGPDHGMHFPLHKGTEVLLTYIDGDPDRPIIAGAVPNPEHPSQITSADQTMSKLTTSGGNKIHIEDHEGKQRILLHTPTHGTFLRLGSPNDPPPPAEASDDPGEYGYKLVSEKGIKVMAGCSSQVLLGNKFEMVYGAVEDIVLSALSPLVATPAAALAVATPDKLELNVGTQFDIVLGGDVEFKPIQAGLTMSELKMKGEVSKVQGSVDRVAGDVETLEGRHDRLQGEAVKLAGQTSALTGEVNQLAGEVSKLEGETAALAGSVTTAYAGLEELAGAVSRGAGEETAMLGECFHNIGEANKVIGENIRVIGNSNDIEGETNKISGEINTISGLIMNI